MRFFLPSPGSPRERLPRLQRYYEDAMTSRRSFLRTSLPSFGSSSVALAWFAPATGKRAVTGLDLVTRWSYRDVAERTAGSPTFLGSPWHLCPVLRPRTDRLVRPFTTIWHGPRMTLPQGLRQPLSFGAHSHGLSARCLRFAARITPRPRKTRYRQLARFFRVGLVSHWAAAKSFRRCHSFTLSSSFPKHRGAQCKLVFPSFL